MKSLNRFEKRLAKLEQSTGPTSCSCLDERFDFGLLSSTERRTLADIIDRTQPEAADSCPACGQDGELLFLHDLRDSELELLADALERCAVESGPHEYFDLPAIMKGTIK